MADLQENTIASDQTSGYSSAVKTTSVTTLNSGIVGRSTGQFKRVESSRDLSDPEQCASLIQSLHRGKQSRKILSAHTAKVLNSDEVKKAVQAFEKERVGYQ